MATELYAVFSKIDFDKASKSSDNIVKYGTAGFRDKADGLDFVFYRVGLIAALRSKSLSGKVIGLMVTASHNPEQDNGVKLVDPNGEMLQTSWEEIATAIANAETSKLPEVLEGLVVSLSINWSEKATVFVGRDTRPSSDRLASEAIAAIKVLGGTVVDCGIVTTPMLHYFVAEANSRNTLIPPSNEDYYNKLAGAFATLNNNIDVSGSYVPTIHFDGANGVGSIAMHNLRDALNSSSESGRGLNVQIFNSGTGRLNYMCGADYVKVNMKAPDGVPIEANVRNAAVDGDADRLIYFYFDKTRRFHVLDGDKIAILLASYLIELVRAAKLDLNLGLVQTAYANGASTDYVSQVLKVPLACTETGVKHLHHKALEYDIGVYFEANGHGTIVYSDKAIALARSTAENASVSDDAKVAAQRLLGMAELTNQVVGDALSDMLLVETVLRAKGWDASEWESSYTDLPSRLAKVTIKNRDVVVTEDAGRRCVSPPGLQEKINEVVSKYSRGRCFVRASGTEDVVRIYSEASTQVEADLLGSTVAGLVYDMADGVGERPVSGF